MSETILKAEGLSCGYGGKNVLSGIALTLERGTLCAVIGKNGSGKSTLLKALAGLIPFEGTIAIREQTRFTPNARARLVSYLPQQGGTYLNLTALETVLMAYHPYLRLMERPGRELIERARKTLSELGADGFMEKSISELSCGQRQLVLWARTLVTDSPILLMDEPDSALDPDVRAKAFSALKKRIRSGTAALVSMHDLNASLRYADRLLVLGDGRLKADIMMKYADRKSVQTALDQTFESLTVCETDGRLFVREE